MARIPHSARTLTDQVRKQFRRKPDSKAGLETSQPHGDPDGLRVHRSVKFDKTSSKWLERVLPHMDDPRIIGHKMERGHMVVTFHGGPEADFRHPFPLRAADMVAADEDTRTPVEGESEGDDGE